MDKNLDIKTEIIALENEKVDSITENIVSQLVSESHTNAYGEPMAFVNLDSERVLEIILEKDGLEPDEYYYSGFLHASEDECDCGKKMQPILYIEDAPGTKYSDLRELVRSILKVDASNENEVVGKITVHRLVRAYEDENTPRDFDTVITSLSEEEVDASFLREKEGSVFRTNGIYSESDVYVESNFYVGMPWSRLEKKKTELNLTRGNVKEILSNIPADILDGIIGEVKSTDVRAKEKYYLLNVTFFAGSDDKGDVDNGLFLLATKETYTREKMEEVFRKVNGLLDCYEENDFPISYEIGLNVNTLMEGIAIFTNGTLCESPHQHKADYYYEIKQWQ